LYSLQTYFHANKLAFSRILKSTRRQCNNLVLMAFPWHCTDLNAHTVVVQEWSALTILEKILCFKTIILNSSSAFFFNISLSISSKLYSFHSKKLPFLDFFVVSYSQCNVLTGHHCVPEIIWSVISWCLYHLSFQQSMRELNFFLCVYYMTTGS
jgi:hypothetical protein